MSTVDMAKLTQPISPDMPSGPSLDNDIRFFQFKEATEATPERGIGDKIEPAKPPDWKKVLSLGAELAQETRDLRIFVEMALAGLAVDGFSTFRDCLTVLRDSVTSYWDSVHPQLDPQDPDSVLRVNVLENLSIERSFEAERFSIQDVLSLVELVNSPRFGKITWRDVLVANDKRKPIAGHSPMEKSQIDAILKDSEFEKLRSQGAAVRDCLQLVSDIDQSLTDRVGAENTCNFDALLKELRGIDEFFKAGLALRGEPASSGSPQQGTSDAAEKESGKASVKEGSEKAASTASALSTAGEIHSRDDVIKSLERIVNYYWAHEPSSPIPVVLMGAKRLVAMDFLQIMEVLPKETLDQLKKVAGVTDNQEDSAQKKKK